MSHAACNHTYSLTPKKFLRSQQRVQCCSPLGELSQGYTGGDRVGRAGEGAPKALSLAGCWEVSPVALLRATALSTVVFSSYER